jgi:seryl-tRNA(Sec) selenium transferase
MDILGTQQKRRHKLVHHVAADAATKHMTQNVHLKIVHKTGSRSNKKQHAVGCEYIHIDANSDQLTV